MASLGRSQRPPHGNKATRTTGTQTATPDCSRRGTAWLREGRDAADSTRQGWKLKTQPFHEAQPATDLLQNSWDSGHIPDT